MGYTLRYERYRTIYGYKGSSGYQQLAYDETPFGSYIKFAKGRSAGSDRSAVGLPAEGLITVGYPTLYSTRSKESRRPPSKLLPRIRKA